MVDTRDLKSLDPKGRAGSSPVPGTSKGVLVNNRYPLFRAQNSIFNVPIQFLPACGNRPVWR